MGTLKKAGVLEFVKKAPPMYNWHVGYLGYYTYPNFGFYLSEMPSGCGCLILSRYFNLIKGIDESDQNFIDNLLENLKSNGVGAVITTVGQDVNSFMVKKFLDLWKFKEVSLYNNYRHSESGRYKQGLYIREL